MVAGATAALGLAGCGEKENPGGREASEAEAPGEPGTGSPAAEVKPDTAVSLYENYEEQLDRFASALRGVRESESPAEFARKVELVTVEMKAIASRLLDVDVPPDEAKRTLSERRKAREEEMQRSFGDLEIFLNGLEPAVKASVEETLKKFMTSMGRMQEEVFSKYFDFEEPPDSPAPPPEPPQ